MSRNSQNISASAARLIVDHLADVVVRVGTDGKVTYISPSIRRYGHEPRALIGQDGLDLVHPQDRANFAANAAALVRGEIDGGVNRQHRIVTADGQIAWVEGNPQVVRGPAGEPLEFINVFRDITARRAVEDQAREQSELFEAAFKYAAIGMALVGLDGGFLRINGAFCDLTGYGEAEMLALDFQTITHPDDLGLDLEQLDQLTRGLIDSYRMDKRYIRKDGAVVWAHLTVSMVRGADGSPRHYVSQVQDLSERKAAEEALAVARLQAEAAAAAKAQFLANMSHEIRTPLTAVLGFTGLLREHPTIDGVAAGYVDRITVAGNGLLALVNDILDFSKLEAGEIAIERQATSVRDLVREVAQVFEAQAADHGLELTCLVDGGMPASVAADGHRLRQVLLNLAGNAVKFTKAGRITLEASWQDPGAVRFVVRDTGPGISPEGQARLFQRFSQVDGSTTRTHGGTGLGLAICKGLVEAMGGQIGVDSQEGQGSAFHFEVPAQPLAPAANEDEAADDALPVAGARVLVVDDNAVNRELVSALLGAYDLDLATADSGEAAVAACGARGFDMVLMDIRMPGMDGRQAMRLIRDGAGPNARTPIIAFTADADRDSVDTLMAAGFDDHLAKPIDGMDLILCVTRWTGCETWRARGQQRRA